MMRKYRLVYIVSILLCSSGLSLWAEEKDSSKPKPKAPSLLFNEREDTLYEPGRDAPEPIRVTSDIPSPPSVVTNEVLMREEDFARLPSMGFSQLGEIGGLRAFTVKESVGDGAALLLHLNPGIPGRMMALDISMESLQQRLKENEGEAESLGMSFWMKGDGSSSFLVIRWGAEHVARVRMKNKEWHKVVLPWHRFRPSLRILQSPAFLTLSIEGLTYQAHWCLIDRMHVFTAPATVEEITPTLAEDLDADFPIGQWIERAEELGEARHVLNDFLPATIVVYGDRYLLANYLVIDAAEIYPAHTYSYGRLLQRRLAKHYKYSSSDTDFQLYMPKNSIWNQFGAYHPQRARLNMHVLATSGSTLLQMADHVESVHRLNPNIIILQAGQEDLIYGDPNSYRADLEGIIQRLKRDGLKIILCTPVPTGLFDVSEGKEQSAYERSKLFAEVIREAGAAHNLPVADVFSMLSARGTWGLGEILSTPKFPNLNAHRMIADLLFGLITEQNNLTVWTEIPYK